MGQADLLLAASGRFVDAQVDGNVTERRFHEYRHGLEGCAGDVARRCACCVCLRTTRAIKGPRVAPGPAALYSASAN
jgi:hypothetical protein